LRLEKIIALTAKSAKARAKSINAVLMIDLVTADACQLSSTANAQRARRRLYFDFAAVLALEENLNAPRVASMAIVRVPLFGS
jgi:phosphotransferase system HPr-like phosphotransfer protein